MSFDSKINCEIFRELFSNLVRDLVKKLPAAPNLFGMGSVEAYYDKNISIKENFALTDTTVVNILKLLEGINPSKAAGLDKIIGRFLKEGANVLALPITHICNLSIQLSVFPDKCKQAKLKPLFKKGSTTDPKNYRPISLLGLTHKSIYVQNNVN